MNELVTETLGKVALARFTDAEGKVSVVQIHAPWQRLQAGASYYNEVYAGHVKCICCEAPVRAVPAKISSGGSSGKGQNGYFSPVERHDENCIVPTRKVGQRAQKIDRTKGYRIHINTAEYSELFTEASGAYEVSPGGRIKITDPDLRDREVYTVKDTKDFVRFIETADPKRMNDTIIIHQNKKYSWEEVVLRHGKEARFPDAVERARGADPEDLPVVLMEMKTNGTGLGKFKGPITTIEGPYIDYGRDDRGKPRRIYPTVKINNREAYSLFWEFGHEGSIFVMGRLRVDTWVGDHITKDSAIVYINDTRQVAHVDMDNLKNKVTANAERANRRAAKADPGTDFHHN